MALCGYFLVGYPSPDEFFRMVRAAHNLDVIEFGIPTDMPYIDGPVIAGAHEVVTRRRGIHAEAALALTGGLSGLPQPSFVMTYATVGRELEGFLRLCVRNGVQGVLVPDIDSVEGAAVANQARSLGLASIMLLDIHATIEHLRWCVEYSDLIYLKAATGRTGEQIEVTGDLREALESVIHGIRALKPSLAIGVGIGLQQPEQIAALAQLDVDMAIVGTKVVEHLQKGERALVDYLQTLRDATAYT